jgi:dihydrodipicolinate synthase/N-acetylneuraminate lyase
MSDEEAMRQRIRGVVAPVVTPFKADPAPDSQRFNAHSKRLLSAKSGMIPLADRV